MKKLLFILNYPSPETRKFKLDSFSISAFMVAQKLGYEFHINTNSQEVIDKNEDPNVHYHLVEIYRNPFSKDTLVAYKQLKKLLCEENFDVIHCNTPVGGLLGRICGKQAKVPKIIYQAHGFHFYKGAPKKNWILYYTAERFLAHWTDALITINQEDYEAAQKFHLRNGGKVYYIPGVGIDLKEFSAGRDERLIKRNELELLDSDLVFISMGDLIPRKNYKIAIEAFAVHARKNKNMHYIICGKGSELESLKETSKQNGVVAQVHFLGFRDDIKDLLKASDVFFFTSLQEGLPRSTMEAMASGLPVLCSRIRGNTDLIDEGKGGLFFDPKNADEISQSIGELLTMDMVTMGRYNLDRIVDFSTDKVEEKELKVYKSCLNLGGGNSL